MEPSGPAHWAPLAIPAVFFTYFLGGLVPFAIRSALRGGLPNNEPRIEERRKSALVPRWAAYYLLWILAPFERLLVRLRVFPNSVTIASVVMSCGAAVALAKGWFGLGGWLYLLTGILDILDGRVARATGQVTQSGALFDSVIDRYAEFAAFTGLVIYYRDSWVLYGVLGLMAGSFMISYARARGEGLGVKSDVGTMQRPERILYLGVALAAAPFAVPWLEPATADPIHHVAVGAVLILAVATNLTAVTRFSHIFHELRELEKAPSEPAVDPEDSSRRGPEASVPSLGRDIPN